MLFDWWQPNYEIWLFPAALVTVPGLAALICMALRRQSIRYEDRIDYHPGRTNLFNLLFGSMLLLSVGALLWRPLTLGIFLAGVVTPCFLHFSGRMRSWRHMRDQPNRATTSNINFGSFVLLTAGALLWASAIFHGAIFAMGVAGDASEVIVHQAALFLAIFYSGVFCGVGAYLRITWRETLAQRKATSSN